MRHVKILTKKNLFISRKSLPQSIVYAYECNDWASCGGGAHDQCAPADYAGCWGAGVDDTCKPVGQVGQGDYAACSGTDIQDHCHSDYGGCSGSGFTIDACRTLNTADHTTCNGVGMIDCSYPQVDYCWVPD